MSGTTMDTVAPGNGMVTSVTVAELPDQREDRQGIEHGSGGVDVGAVPGPEVFDHCPGQDTDSAQVRCEAGAENGSESTG